jgi:hypothetical protein
VEELFEGRHFDREIITWPQLTKRPPGTHKQTYQERFGGITAEICQKILCALFAPLVTAMTGINCFPYTPE